jgi:hypothetical protein
LNVAKLFWQWQTWQVDIILVVLDNLSVDWIGQNKESWDKCTSYSSRSSFICAYSTWMVNLLLHEKVR